jgi:hypothetical protein
VGKEFLLSNAPWRREGNKYLKEKEGTFMSLSPWKPGLFQGNKKGQVHHKLSPTSDKVEDPFLGLYLPPLHPLFEEWIPTVLPQIDE